MLSYAKKIIAFIISAVLTILPFSATPLTDFTTKEADVLLNTTIISDVHIDYREFFCQSVFSSGLNGIDKSMSPVDAVIISGDLTNYGDSRSIDKFFSLYEKYCDCDNGIFATGNHDIGHVEDITQEDARQYFIKKYSEFSGEKISNVYYSTMVNGYRFIVLGDEDDDSWDWPTISDEQLAFLDAELSKSAGEGKPAFVVCHWPLSGTNGEEIIWDDGDIKYQSDAIKAIVEKYKNVFFISGHLHAGINGEFVKNLFDFSCVETINGVNYINLPTFTLVNRFGIPWGGTGFQMEVYANKVLFRARNYVTSEWYDDYQFEIALV